MRRQRAETGFVVVWVLVVLALATAGLSSIGFTLDEGPPSQTVYQVFGVSLTLAALGMFVEAKRDLYVFCQFTLVFAVITGMITGAVALYSAGSHPIAATVAVISALVGVWCVVYVVRTQHSPEVLPNILRQKFRRSAIYEIDGVQLAVVQSSTEVGSGNGLAVQVVAQNCWDKERQPTFVLKLESQIFFKRTGLKFLPESKLVIPGAAVAMLTIPVMAEPSAKGTYSLRASSRISGEGGFRVRRWRAQGLSAPIPLWLSALLVFTGLHVWGGGLKLQVKVRPSMRTDPPSPEFLDARTEVVWQPEARDLVTAVRAA
jgi:hypothetical protein